jgi:hypothetical protein
VSFNLDDYVDVATRLAIFREKFPTGSLQSEVTLMNDGVLCKAYAYRSPDDVYPGVGHSFLKIPGTTPYTKDSEVENAETSAWGRAMVAALAVDAKRVASADEVRNKSGGSGSEGGSAAGVGDGAKGAAVPSAVAPTDKQVAYLRRLMDENGVTDLGKPVNQLTKGEASQFIEQLKDGSFVVQQELANVGAVPVDEWAAADSDIPFARTIDGLGN